MNNIETKALFIAIVGEPNVGKSSILNMLLNQKISIVSPKPQTTRNKITGILTRENTQIVFTDTPGIHIPRTHLGNYMVDEINDSVSGVDACMHVVEAGKEITKLDKKLIDNFIKLKVPVLLVINKIDLISDKSLIMDQIKLFNDIFKYNATIPISARNQDGKDGLLNEMEKLAVPSVHFFPEDLVTDQPERTMVAEIVREKTLRLLDKEIPHGIAVFTEKMKSRNDSITDIECIIYCEKDSHKGIIIGKNGQMLKRIGSYARQNIEEMLDKKVNLQLWVKVKEDWRNRDNILKSLGYTR